MQRDTRKYLLDVSIAIDSIYDYLGESRDFNVYENNKLLRRAVEREFEIIGEAINQLLKIQSDFPIANARRIVNLRNWVIHAYDNIDNVIIWGIIDKDLPLLKQEVVSLLNDPKQHPNND